MAAIYEWPQFDVDRYSKFEWNGNFWVWQMYALYWLLLIVIIIVTTTIITTILFIIFIIVDINVVFDILATILLQ